ncbi:MAG: hydroxyacid dehydrogenase [Candidatus Omnitrophota bacterium]
MKKPRVGILLDAKMKSQILNREEMARLKKFAAVQFEEFRELDEAAAGKLIRGTDGIITGWGTPTLTKEMLDSAPNLKIIAHSAGSVKGIVVGDEVWKRKITVTSAASSIAIGVAEFSLGLLITGLKRVYPFAKTTKQGIWKDDAQTSKVKEFYKISIGVVGAGYVGRHLIKLLKNFDVKILLYDPFVTKEEAAKLGAEKTSLKKLMQTCEAVSLHAPSLPATYHMINEGNLSLMKENTVLVNTARGSLIDEEALIKVLRTGKIFALLDVTDPEPTAEGSPLRTLENVVLIPHIAGAVANNRFRQGNYEVTELERFFSGKKPVYPVTKDILERIA